MINIGMLNPKDMNKLTIISITIILSLAGCKNECNKSKTTHSYYADSQTGNDKNSGTSPKKAWKSLHRIEEQKLEVGDQIYLSGNSHFPGSLKQSLGQKILRQYLQTTANILKLITYRSQVQVG
jgi:uncharacterized Fe-S cluster-containing MiaB family protein